MTTLLSDMDDEELYDDDTDDIERACIECGEPGLDWCCCCGGWLCGMHSEIGAGFCPACPTLEWMDEQIAELHAAGWRA
mgnify:CR=1 FL=1